MGATVQLALPLLDGDATDEPARRVMVGAANAAVAKALADPAEWPFGTAVLSGPPRSGKSLLGRWFAQAHANAQVIDDADAVPDADLFHAWNRAQEQRRSLLLIVGANGWRVALPDLRSRLSAALPLTIDEPDDAMLADLLQAHAQRRRLVLDPAAATYLVPRITRSFAAAEQVVAEIDRLSLERKVPPTRSIWREALDAVQGPRQERLF